MLRKIALLIPQDEPKNEFDFFSFYTVAIKNKIEIKLFEKSEEIDAFAPDCVLAFSPMDAKLTRYPTYGLLNRDIQHYFELPRFTRNLLTYDGYLTISAHNKELLSDLLFGSRKLNSEIAFFDFTPLSYKSTYVQNENAQQLLVINNTPEQLNGSKLLKKIQTPLLEAILPHTPNNPQATTPNTLAYFTTAAQDYKAALFLSINDTDMIPNKLLSLIAQGFPVICIHSPILEHYFGNNLYYIDPKLNTDEAADQVNMHLTTITQNKNKVLLKTHRAKEIFDATFSMEKLFDNLKSLHQQTILNKGYQLESLKQLKTEPSVSYIIRTGGKHRDYLERALDSLLKQSYQKIQVIFVIHAAFDYLPDLLKTYKKLNPKVVECFKSIRSDAICAGIAAVTTDYFGLLDDDDELHANHVFSLIKTLQYHDRRDLRGAIKMAYSGSIVVHDSQAVTERSEYMDSRYQSRDEKRVTEHFRFFRQSEMSKHSWYMMSNSWLASRELIDDEILTPPGIDTCEDLYFELQFAQRTHFAFSVEMTAIHHYHSRGNSTFVDSHRHLSDTQRIALRNFSRYYEGEFIYEAYHLLIGQPKNEVTDRPKFLIIKNEYSDQPKHVHNPLAPGLITQTNQNQLFKKALWIGFTKFPKIVRRYRKLDKNKKKYYKQMAYAVYRKEGFFGLASKALQKTSTLMGRSPTKKPRIFKEFLIKLSNFARKLIKR